MDDARGVGRILSRLRSQGPAWIGRRLAHEWREPSTPPGRRLFALRARLASSLWRWRAGPAVGLLPADILVAIVDLAASPITFDVIWLIVGAEMERRRLGLAGIHFIIVPGHHDGLREEGALYEAVVDPDRRRWRLHNIVLAAFGLLPTTKGVTMATDRDHAARLCQGSAVIFPRHWTPGQPQFVVVRDLLGLIRSGEAFRVLTAPPAAHERIGRWAERVAAGRRLVTVTLRTYDFHTVRNSNLAAWGEFTRSLDPAMWCVVFLADTDRTLDPVPAELEGQLFLPEASWNLGLRMAVYEAAYLNLGINTGPMLLPFFSPTARGLMFGLVNEDAPQTSTEYMNRLGFVPGECPLGPEGQGGWVWESDNAQSIIRSFHQMVERIESCRGRG